MWSDLRLSPLAHSLSRCKSITLRQHVHVTQMGVYLTQIFIALKLISSNILTITLIYQAREESALSNPTRRTE
jgi:hypothetical protein